MNRNCFPFFPAALVVSVQISLYLAHTRKGKGKRGNDMKTLHQRKPKWRHYDFMKILREN